jgi:hypothetical protein
MKSRLKLKLVCALLLAGPGAAGAQGRGEIQNGSALGGSIGHLWVDDTPGTEFTLLGFRWSTLRAHRVGVDFALAFATGDGLDGIDLSIGADYHLPLGRVSLLPGVAATAVAAGGGDDAGGGAGLQFGSALLVPIGSRIGVRLDAAWRYYLTGGDGFDGVLVGLGITSLPPVR